MADENKLDITALTVQLLSAFVSKNTVSSEGLPDLIKTTRAALTGDLNPAASEPAAPEYVPAVSIRKSLASHDHIISLIDGRPYKTLKRHLATHNLTPEQYRERYNLPKTYPLVAPAYSDARRAVAERLGLGKKPAQGARGSNTPAPPQAKTSVKEAPASPAPAKAAAKSVASKPAPAKAAEPKAAVAKAKPDKPAAAPAAAPRKRLGIATAKADKPAVNSAEKSVAPPSTSAPKAKAAETGKSKPAAAKVASKTKAKAPASAAAAAGDTASTAADTPAAS